MSAAPVALAFGSNLGDRSAHIGRALALLAGFVDRSVVSGLYESEPMYRWGQGPFLNGCLTGSTELGPWSLLRALKDVERHVGRQSRERYGPREIDLDIVGYGVLQVVSRGTVELSVPHPQAAERRFVLEPLYEIAPSWTLPGFGAVSDLVRAPAIASQRVKRVSDAPV